MDGDSTWQYTWMERLRQAETEEAFFFVLTEAAKSIGFDYCGYGMRGTLPVSNPRVYMRNNYDEAWHQRYLKENYVFIDPTVAHGMKSIEPLVWTDRLFSGAAGFWEDARSHGLRVGWSQSSYDARGIGGMLTLARSHEPLSELELREKEFKMMWLVQAGHIGMARFFMAREPAIMLVELSPREVEILRWSADGKTSNEISRIIGITTRTVNFHIQRCMDKLGVSNRTAAVLKAAALRLL